MKIKVAFYGMDLRCESRMKTIFMMNFKDQCEVTEIDDADTVLIDMDEKDVASTWSEFRLNHPDIPVIIMATEHVDLIDTTYISKPAKLAELLEALKSTSKKEVSSNLNTGPVVVNCSPGNVQQVGNTVDRATDLKQAPFFERMD